MAKQQKQQAQRKKEIQQAREKMLAKHKTRYDHIKGMIPIKRESSIVMRDIPNVPSLNSFAGNTERRDKKEYTGTKLVGIATMHKSNMVPVFSQEEAEQISKMRRN